MWRSLVWKEWHEQRWRLWFGVFLVGMFTLIGLRTRIMPDEQIIILTIMVGGMLFPLMVSMGLVAPERTEGTIVRLLALPVPPWKVLAAKGVVGAAVCAAPVVVSALIALLVAGNREMAWGELIGLYALATGVTLAVFTWLTAAAVRQPSEARAGLVGIGVMIGWFLLMMVAAAIGSELFNRAPVEDWVAMFGPFGLVALKSSAVPGAAVIAIQAVSLALVWWWAAARIGKPGKVVA
jgi:ABC-type transport system involved in multi-copper enzyme maturation permease subunit